MSADEKRADETQSDSKVIEEDNRRVELERRNAYLQSELEVARNRLGAIEFYDTNNVDRVIAELAKLKAERDAALDEVERLKDGIAREIEDMDGLARDVGIWGKQEHADELFETYDGIRALLNPDTPEGK